MAFALTYISKWLSLKDCMTCHLFDGGVFPFPLCVAAEKERCCEKLQHGGFGLKLTACYKSKMCHSTTDSP